MAIRFDAIGDYLERATITPPFSICGWAYMVNDRNDYSTLFAIDQQVVGAGTGRSLSLQTDNDGVTLALWDNTAYVGSRTLTPGQWFFWAVVFSSNTSAVWYHANLGDLSLYVSPTATTSNASNQYHHLSNNAYSEWFDGRQGYIKHWSVAKTEAQLTSEMLTIRPMSLSSVYLFTPTFPGSGIRARDYSGNGRNWTEGGTLTDEDPPPISWGNMAYLISKVATGGTGYTQSATGTLTSAGAVNRQGQKMVAGAVAGVGGLIRGALKAVAGTLTLSGTLTTVRTYLTSLAGTLTSGGSVSRRTNKAVGGVLSHVGGLIREGRKALTGAVSSSGALATIRTFLVSLAGTLASSGALTRRTGKPMSGNVTPSGLLFRNVFKNLTGALSPAGALTRLRAFFVTVGGVLSSTGVLSKGSHKNMGGMISSSGMITRAVSKLFSGVLGLAGILATSISGLISPGRVMMAFTSVNGLSLGFTTVSAVSVAFAVVGNVAGDFES